MKRVFKILSALLLLATFKSFGLSSEHYFGAEAQIGSIKFKESYGKGMLSDYSPGFNIFSGINVTENLGFEVGHGSTNLNKSHSHFKHGAVINGLNTANYKIEDGLVGAYTFETRGKLHHSYFDLTGYVPIGNDERARIFCSVGASTNKLTVQRKSVYINGDHKQLTRKFSGSSKGLRGSIGVEYMIFKDVFLRSKISFINTGNISLSTNDNLIEQHFLPKSIYTVGIGGFVKF